ncbi:transcriptional regulator [Klebsiella oxytoca]|uniref:winged helix-turn-helix domain-containing protein n=1 Tax=Klebsiella oxytoca TaxID=571 RepID=UPI00066B532B|nr:winged helix-turn-helix domain-containing protein [Klebsiella oxytoca]EJA2383397.1 winged helix-turn-helix domain-containing protein [Klebsiella oxytoca]EJZ8298208.1 winged helix-turn-helix domain-containing protein [Klebsiella oxytoca]EKM0800900.1 winged helix-turn-helix domain-containing protein [Klebsiella oxytoca]EKT7899194.1 winged helix-turn-helix domain-containing protein [Klebsiella oxytoca]ELI3673400.1 winged helix-turn-helix domain-containing protein [Klebsiella oxytoca]
MKYSIVEKIIFDSDSNWIVCRDNDSVLIEKKLSRTASQILAILLANYGELVERDYLLSEVWETRGHHGSNSSLNQYISILRKTLHEMGIPKDCIVSEPKKGFIFSRAVPVAELFSPEPLAQEDSLPDELPQQVVITPAAIGSLAAGGLRPDRNTVINMALWILVAITMIASLFVLNKTRNITSSHEPVKLFTLKNCQVLSDTNHYLSYQTIMKHIIYDIHPDIEVMCSPANMVVFLKIQPSIYFGHAGRVFLALCTGKPNGNGLTYCDNNYRYQYSYIRKQ